MNENHYIAIMAGGVGTRFWPASRSARPKQFLDILGVGRSLLQMTFDRACKIVPVKNVLIVSNKAYKSLILSQLPEIQEEQILLEPSMNNTAPCVAFTALHLKAINNESTFAVIPSDHMILKEEEFVRKMQMALDHAANHEEIVTLGIQPTRPDTGYGYINFEKEGEIKKVLEFKEKPDKATAIAYLESGDYLWNAGIFCWNVHTILKSFSTHSKDILNVLNESSESFGTSGEQDYIDRVYPNTDKISIDYAILEKSQNVRTIPSDIGWSDLGTWNSLYDYLEKDDCENVLQGNKFELIESNGNLIRAKNKDKLIVVKGINDFIVVDDDDVLLIYPKSQEQEIKQVRNSLSFSDLK